MKFVYAVLNWGFGLLFLLLGTFGVLAESVLQGIPFIFISLILLPPVRNFVYSKTRKEMSVVVRTILIFVFLGVFGVFNHQNMEKKHAQDLATQQAKQKNEQQRLERKQQKVVYFNANREKIILDIKASLTAKEYQSVLSQSNKYLVLDDKELNELNAIAKTELAAIKKAEEAEKKRLADIEKAKQAEIRKAELAEKKRLADIEKAEQVEKKRLVEIENAKQVEIRKAELAEKKRLADIEKAEQAEIRKAELAEKKRLADIEKAEKTKQLLAELKNVPVENYEKNKNLYSQLSKINPDNKKYKIKLKFYENKISDKKKDIALTGSDRPKCTQDEMWEYMVNNAYRVADKYATNHNPRSTFFALKKEYSFKKQLGGNYKGKYLLFITNRHGSDTSFATLLPLFDVNKSTKELDDEKSLWKVVIAKLNGVQY
ncbi:hypothetical protein QUF74_09990 [Candidatus Halobeggiatoa sp. HSG11]|nr:hypothetical protein [Candidatus Halobeggiatoa sp. HSG11]